MNKKGYVNLSNAQLRKRVHRAFADVGCPDAACSYGASLVLGIRAHELIKALGLTREAWEVMNAVLTTDALKFFETWRKSASRYQIRMCVKFLVAERMPVPIVARVTGCRESTIRHHARSMRVKLPALHWGKRAPR